MKWWKSRKKLELLRVEPMAFGLPCQCSATELQLPPANTPHSCPCVACSSMLWLEPSGYHCYACLLSPSADIFQQSVYQVPKSKQQFTPVDPQDVAGIYEIEPNANPLHPRHQSNLLHQSLDSIPTHDSLRRDSEPVMVSHPIATMHKNIRVPKTPPPKTRPPDYPPPPHPTLSWSGNGAHIADCNLSKMRSYSTDELGSTALPHTGSPIGGRRSPRSYSITALVSPFAGGREVRPHSAVQQQGSPHPLVFNPPLRQQKRRSEALCMLHRC